MSGVWTDRASNDKNRLIRELLRGRDLAIQLQALMSKASGDDQAVLACQILGKILRLFSQSISVTSAWESEAVSYYVMSRDSRKSKKRPGSKQARACYKPSYVQRCQPKKKWEYRY